jgi:hypothetical protein
MVVLLVHLSILVRSYKMTKPIYEEVTSDLGADFIKRTDADGQVWWIPTDPANSDYQRYLNPEAEQSTPNV